MQKREYFIVWNAAKSEAVITDDENDAMLAAGMIEPHNYCSTLCRRFDELYSDDRRTVKKFTLSKEKANEDASHN